MHVALKYCRGTSTSVLLHGLRAWPKYVIMLSVQPSLLMRAEETSLLYFCHSHILLVEMLSIFGERERARVWCNAHAQN